MIAIGSDHTSISLKNEICRYLEEYGHSYKDVGTYTPQDRENYADIAELACTAIANGECDRGILLCGTGIGISMAANKMRGIRAAVCTDYFTAKYTRLHNDANVLCMGSRVTGSGVALEIVEVFLGTDFEGGRHAPRVAKIMELDSLR